MAVFDGVDRWAVFTAKNSPLPAGNVYKVANDNRGNHWFGNDSRGLARLSGFVMPEKGAVAEERKSGKTEERKGQTEQAMAGDERVRINPHLQEGYITISIESSQANITFTNSQGKVVKTVNGYKNNQHISIKKMPKGMYMVGVKTVRGEKKIKFNLK